MIADIDSVLLGCVGIDRIDLLELAIHPNTEEHHFIIRNDRIDDVEKNPRHRVSEPNKSASCPGSESKRVRERGTVSGRKTRYEQSSRSHLLLICAEQYHVLQLRAKASICWSPTLVESCFGGFTVKFRISELRFLSETDTNGRDCGATSFSLADRQITSRARAHISHFGFHEGGDHSRGSLPPVKAGPSRRGAPAPRHRTRFGIRTCIS